MGRAKSIIITLFFVLVVVAAESSMTGHPGETITPHPVCASQYALANYACSRIPFSPLPLIFSELPPKPPVTLSQSLEEQQPVPHHHHHHHHHHGHKHHHKEINKKGTPEEEDCCRWLYEMDNNCVCDLIVHLPEFLSKPGHAYTIFVGEVCKVAFTCSGRVIRK